MVIGWAFKALRRFDWSFLRWEGVSRRKKSQEVHLLGHSVWRDAHALASVSRPDYSFDAFLRASFKNIIQRSIDASLFVSGTSKFESVFET